MLPDSASQASRSWLRLSIALLCVWLILLGGTLSATHTHERGGLPHPDCGLCVVAHTAIQIGTPAPQIFVFLVTHRIELTPEKPRIEFFALDPLFSRPPPDLRIFA